MSTLQIRIKTIDNSELTLQISDAITVDELKNTIQQVLASSETQHPN